MGQKVTSEVFCDNEDCSNWAGTVTGIKPDIKGAREIAHDAGWVQRKDKSDKIIDLCPTCAEVKS